MSDVLVIAAHAQGALAPVTAELVSAGAALAQDGGGRLAVAVVAAEPDPLVEQLSLAGVDEVIVVVTPAPPSSDDLRLAVAGLCADRQPDVVLAGFTADAMAYAPAAAMAGDLGFASDVTTCRHEPGALVVTREMHGGRLQAELGVTLPALLLLRPGAWAPAAQAGSAPTVTPVAAPDGPARVRHVRFEPPPAADVDLAAAEGILAIGRGIGEQQSIDRYAGLADALGLTLAASGPLVGVGWMPAERKVGQSGQTVAPKVYLAFGISGAAQHLAGMRGARTIVAINTDPQAPIFGAAHFGAVADAGDVAHQLAQLV